MASHGSRKRKSCVQERIRRAQPWPEPCMARLVLASESRRGELFSSEGVCCRDKNELLNTTTTVIEYWQDEPRHPIEEARSQFPDCHFHGY